MSDVRHAISVVVPTKDRAGLLSGCLDALRGSLRDEDELIVVDSASRDVRTRAEAASHGATYVRCGRRGASLARNAGCDAARNDVVAFVDDDIRVDGGWADAVAATFRDHPDASFVTGRITLPPGIHPDRPIALKEETVGGWLDGDSGGVIGHSANLAVRRDALIRLGGFDEELGAGARFRGAEDLDLFDRLFASGYRGRYEPAMSASHVHWRRGRDLIALEWGYGVGGGARLAKLLRTDRRKAMWQAKVHLWRAGVKAMLGEIGSRRPLLAYGRAVRTLGVFVGFSTRMLADVVRRGRDQPSLSDPR